MNKSSEFIPVCTPLLGGNEEKYVTQAVHDGWISSSGEYVGRFEKAFAAWCGVKYATALCNGTAALHTALAALGIGAGDEVIIPSFTMIATAFAVCYTGAVPVFVDADKDTWNIDEAAIEKKITKRTKAIMPVHIFGNPCDMDAIADIAKRHSLFVVEDAAEAHGAKFHGVKTGCFSDIAAFSFFANKNITTGEGGMVVTDSAQYDKLCRYHKNMCFPVDAPRVYLHDDIGFNYRMSNLHAALGLAQVEKADEYIAMRRHNAEVYKKCLNGCNGIIFQKDTEGGTNAHWMNAILLEPSKYGHTRDELIAHLKEYNIDTRLLFVSMHRQKSLQKYGCDCTGEYPVTDKLSENGLYLPSASSLKEETIGYICDVIKEYAL